MAAELSTSNVSPDSSDSSVLLLTCRRCGQLQHIPTVPSGYEATCSRCNATLHQHTPRGIQRTAALAISALILFVPANILPILSITRMGYKHESTIWGGVVDLWNGGTQGIAVIVLFCSIVIPLVKIGVMFYLCATWQIQSPKLNSALLSFIDIVGRWSMLDVFLVAVLVALVKLGSIATVQPGLGILAFAGVVVLTMIASANFDSRLLWLRQGLKT